MKRCENIRGTMRTFKNNGMAYTQCKSLFMSGTPWSQSPGELEGIFKVLDTTEWEKDNRLKHACDAELKHLIASYKRLLQKETEVETNPKLQKEIGQTTNIFAGILEMIMLRRTAALQWFNGPIIKLTKHLSSNISLPFPDKNRGALTRLEDIDKQNKAEWRREWE